MVSFLNGVGASGGLIGFDQGHCDLLNSLFTCLFILDLGHYLNINFGMPSSQDNPTSESFSTSP